MYERVDKKNPEELIQFSKPGEQPFPIQVATG